MRDLPKGRAHDPQYSAPRRQAQLHPPHLRPRRRAPTTRSGGGGGFVLLLSTRPPSGAWRRVLRWCPQCHPTTSPARQRLRAAALHARASRCLAACRALVPSASVAAPAQRRLRAAARDEPASRSLAACPALESSSSAHYPLRRRQWQWLCTAGSGGGLYGRFRHARLAMLGEVSCTVPSASARQPLRRAAVSCCCFRGARFAVPGGGCVLLLSTRSPRGAWRRVLR